MNTNDIERQMRELEYFHSLRLLPNTWTVVRVDGRGFTKFTEPRFKKPFDERFHSMMVNTAQALLEEMHGIYAYTESDEISVLFPREWDFFDRELEKIVSLSASIASAAFTLECGERAQFDSRVWLGANEQLVVDYFRWRQSDATRCALNGWCYWTLRNQGKSVTEATETLMKKSVVFKNELLFQNSINFNDLPLWQRRGTGLYWEQYEKQGFNPIKQTVETTTRRRIKVDQELPMKEAYDQFIRERIGADFSR